MDDSEFLTRAEAALAAIERAIDAVDLDIDVERAGGVLTLELPGASRIVVNLQEPMRQIWVAAKSGGHHFAWTDGAWRDTRDGRELFAALSSLVSAQSGALVILGSR